MKHTVHVVLVGDDPVRNLTPALDPTMAPQEMVLVVSPQMQDHARWLEDVLRPRGVRLTRWPIEDAWDLSRVRHTLSQRMATRPDDDLVLNASGATKPMAFAAFDVFRSLGRPVFYVHPELDRVVWLYHPDTPEPHNLADTMNLQTFMAGHGATVEGIGNQTGVPKPLRALTRTLVTHVERFSKPLASLNWLAGTARGSLRSRALPKDRGLSELVEQFEQAGVLTTAHGHLHFPDEDARFFTQGGWLEAHVFGVLWGLRGKHPIQDLARGVEITRSEGGNEVHNELDVCCLANNGLYLIEAKTKRFNDGGGADVIYKIDTLRELLGAVHARAMVASYQHLGDAHRRRASDLGIATCVGGELKYLEEHLRQLLPAAQ
jgi:hypothetical protein